MDTTIDIQDTFDEVGRLNENGSDGDYTTDDGGCRE